MSKSTFLRRAVCSVLGLLCCASISMAQHPLRGSTARWLDVEEGEYNDLAVSPDGARLYLLDVGNDRVVVYDTAGDRVAGTVAFDRWLAGLALTSDGDTLVVAADSEYVYTIDTGTLTISGSDNAWDFRGGPIAVTPNDATAYVAGSWDIYVVQLTGSGPAIVDTTPGDATVDGLVGANSWSSFENANDVVVSADGDVLFVPIWHNPYHVVSGIAGGTNHTGLTLQTQALVHEYDPPLHVTLSADGETLYDSYGVVCDADDLSLLGRVSLYTNPEAITFDASMSPADVAVDPEGRYIYYAGFAWSYGEPDMATYGGEQLVVASHDTYAMLDLDANSANGLTCIPLPPDPSGARGTYSAHVMQISPDGDRLYMAGGSSGALVVELTHGGEGIWAVSPRRGGDDDVTLTLTGEGFEAGSSVALERTGVEIAAEETVFFSANTLKATFDLTGRARDTYDVVLSTPGGARTVMADAFEIEAARESATIEMIGEATLFSSGASSVRIVCRNTGNIDLINPVITLQLTEDTQYRVELPATVPGGLTQLDDAYTTAVAEHPEYIWVNRIAPQDAYSFWLHVAGPEGVAPLHWDVQLDAAVGYITSEEDDDTAAKTIRSYSPIGDACTIFDAMAKNLDHQLARRGYEVDEADLFEAVTDAFRETAADYGVSKIQSTIAKALGSMIVLAIVPEAAPVYAIVFDGIGDIKSCYDLMKTLYGFDAMFAWDPNDKVSPTGINGYICGNERLRYIIHFENLPEATAPANDVVITDQLDDHLDYATFTVVGSSHPGALTSRVDESTGLATFTFTDIDLPPNVTPPEGEGWVEFTIDPDSGLVPGTVIRNQASIVFDLNDPIVTPAVVHTIDTTAPSSRVVAMPEETVGPSIEVAWSGSDDGVGVWDYTVYVSVDGGGYTAWLPDTTATSATYPGSAGHEYRFYTVARDQLGNTESAPAQPDAETTCVSDATAAGCGAAGSGGAAILLVSVIGLLGVRRRQQ